MIHGDMPVTNPTRKPITSSVNIRSKPFFYVGSLGSCTMRLEFLHHAPWDQEFGGGSLIRHRKSMIFSGKTKHENSENSRFKDENGA